MNLNAINQTWSYVNKNTPFSITRTSNLIKAFKLVEITFENAAVSWMLGNASNKNEIDAASTAVCF